MRRLGRQERNKKRLDAIRAAPQQLITLRIRAAFYAWALRSTCGLRRSVTFDHRSGEPIFGSFQTSFFATPANGPRISVRTVAKDACLTPGVPERLRILACNGTYTSRQGKLNAASRRTEKSERHPGRRRGERSEHPEAARAPVHRDGYGITTQP